MLKHNKRGSALLTIWLLLNGLRLEKRERRLLLGGKYEDKTYKQNLTRWICLAACYELVDLMWHEWE